MYIIAYYIIYGSIFPVLSFDQFSTHIFIIYFFILSGEGGDFFLTFTEIFIKYSRQYFINYNILILEYIFFLVKNTAMEGTVN